VDAATPSTTVNTFDNVHYISQYAPHQTIGPVLSTLGRDVEFLSFAPDCIDRVQLQRKLIFRIPLGWETLHLVSLNSTGPINRYCDEIQATPQEVHSLVGRCAGSSRSGQAKVPRNTGIYFGSGLGHYKTSTIMSGYQPNYRAVLAGQSKRYALPPQRNPRC